MSVFTWTPDYSSALSKKPRVLTAQFGESYAQRTADGINNKPQSWALTFTVSPAVGDLIEAFLDEQGATTAFDWTPPRRAAARFVCTEWSVKENSFGQNVITANFVQDYAP